LSSAAQRVHAALSSGGALFFADLVRVTGLLRTQVEQALGELVAAGCATADGFNGLRALIAPSGRRASFARPAGSRALTVDHAGRWALLGGSQDPAAAPSEEAVQAIAQALLDRYGVVFRALLHREAGYLPPWRDLARVCRRLEARGEIRGGRFVTGFGGEQFALPAAVEGLRAARREAARGDVAISAADPLNLCGIITPGPRVAALTGNRVLYRAGVPVATYVAGAVQWLVTPDPQEEWSARNLLIRSDRERFYVPAAAGRN
jgi:ATP-dependent Lhr-like helicase